MTLIGQDVPNCTSPAALTEMIAHLRAGQGRWRSEAEGEARARAEKLRSSLPSLQYAFRDAQDKIRRRVAPDIDRLERKMQRLMSVRFLPLRWYNHWMRIPVLRRQLQNRTNEPAKAAEPHRRALVAAQAELFQIDQDPEPEIANYIDRRRRQLNRLIEVAESPEHAGAIAELQMVNVLLSGLPDSYAVFHDVAVRTEDWVYDGHEHRRSAQIDHVVLGPNGVFVVEDKLWSGEFVERGQFHDPYRQVRWAGKLCHLVLSDCVQRKIKVREIIATSGHLPAKPADSYAKVLRPSEVCRFIRWFPPELDDATVQRLRFQLAKMIGEAHVNA